MQAPMFTSCIANARQVIGKFLAFVGLCAWAFSPVLAQEWPNAPIKLIIPFAPGGGNDGAGRLLARAMEDRLKVPVVVENKAGANGTIAMNFLRQSKPDGYTLSLVSTGALDVNTWLMNLPYDPVKDFTYLGTIVKFPLMRSDPLSRTLISTFSPIGIPPYTLWPW